MPTYDYDCVQCGGFEALRPLRLRDEPAACPGCGTASARVLAAAPRLALMSDGTRRAMDTNERARHEPASSRDYDHGYARFKHPAGCGCCGSGRRSVTVTAPNGAKSAPSRRPWMISH
ncbi:MAG: zinc ribbon domain-containing protein [Delftia tsuruhatensis]